MSRAVAMAAALTVALVLLEVAFSQGGHAPFGAFAAAGVVGSLVLGLGAKALGKVIQRPVSADEHDGGEDAP